jgi:poly(A) polymerase
MEAKAAELVRRLRDRGFDAYFAGGCVRDRVMGLEPADIDIATDAHPEQVMEIFERTLPIGARFGVVLVVSPPLQFEVSTFRSDEIYVNGRHPEHVTYSDARHDAFRRDFTLNGMFYDPLGQKILDYVGGQPDIERRLIRSIGDPRRRFEEDKLRLMRGVRFAARFGYRIEEETWEATREMAPEILQVSPERIREELMKILLHPSRRTGLLLLRDSGLLRAILPEVCAMEGIEQPPEFHPEGDVWEHTLLMLEGAEEPSHALALAILLHDVGKPLTFSRSDRIRFHSHSRVGLDVARDILGRLRFPNATRERVLHMIRDHMRFMDVQRMKESTLKKFLRTEDFEDHLELHRLDCLASHGDLSNYHYCKEKLAQFKATEEQEPLHPPRILSGHDLIALGYEPSPLFKRILDAVEDAQLEGRVKTRTEALAFVQAQFPLEGGGKGAVDNGP